MLAAAPVVSPSLLLKESVLLGQLVTLDLQQGRLDRTRLKAEANGITNIEYLHAKRGEGRLPCERFERVVLVIVLGEIPDRRADFVELFKALKPGGILTVAELIFDPHFQTRRTVTDYAIAVGFVESGFWGNQFACIIQFEKHEVNNIIFCKRKAGWLERDNAHK